MISVIAAIALGTTAYTIDFKSKGEILLNYITEDQGEGGLFQQDNSQGNLGIKVKVAADLGKGFLGGMTAVGVETTGLDGTFVSNSLQSTRDNTISGGIGLTEAFVVRTIGDTTFKVGRQELNTPMMFSEKQYLHPTTFSAAMAINKSFENTTLMGAYVNSSNDHNSLAIFDENNIEAGTGILGLLYKPMSNMKVNLWYYQVKNVADIVWGETVYAKDNLMFGAQASNITSALNDGTKMTGVQGVYDVEGIRFIGAYDRVEMDENAITMENRGTASLNGKTKLFTQMEENSEYVAGIQGEDTHSYKLGMKTRLKGIDITANMGEVTSDSGTYSETNFGASTRMYDTDFGLIFVDKNDGYKNINSQMIKFKAAYQF